MRRHLGSRPAQQSKTKLADWRNHQIHSHRPPRFVSGSCFVFTGHMPDLTRGMCVCFHAIFCQCLRLSCSLFLLVGKFKDGETPLKAVHVGGGSSRTVLSLEVGVSCSFVVQQETLERHNNTAKTQHPNLKGLKLQIFFFFLNCCLLNWFIICNEKRGKVKTHLRIQPGDQFVHQSLLSALLRVTYQEVDIVARQLSSGVSLFKFQPNNIHY